jgi:hypothetical protein
MPKTEQVLSIFLASPGDVCDERARVDAFVDEWNSLWSEDTGVHLRLLRWETHAYPAIGADGQDVINTQLGEDYDVFLGIMWKRFGTPTGRASSGTVEEFERALKRRQMSGQPELMFYFKKANLDTGDDATQLHAVQQFRSKIAKDGLLYWEFLSSEQFSQLVRVHLTRHVQNWIRRYRERPESANVTQSDFAQRFKGYLDNVKNQSAVLSAITKQFAEINLAYVTAISERVVAVVRAKSDEQLPLESKILTLVEMANEMGRYADAAEHFEASFNAEFSVFLENVLGAAAISIAFPAAQTNPLSDVIVALRGKLHPVDKAMGDFTNDLAKFKLRGSEVMRTFAERSVEAIGKFREHVRFGERMLLESEKLFNTKRRV